MSSTPLASNAADELKPASESTRIEVWAGEVRVNLIRLAAILVFYGYHLVNVCLLSDDPTVAGQFHVAVSALVLAWSIAVVLLYFCLSRRWMPWQLKYIATGWDILLVTALLAVSATPTSPLVVLYFLIIGAAPLRLSLGLVYAATLGSMGAYIVFVGYYAFFLIGAERYYNDAALRIPRTHEVILVLALGAAGIIAGQIVRQSRRLIAGYPVTLDTTTE